MKLVLALTLLGAALAALPAAAGAGLVVRGDEQLAGYRVKADGTLGGAREAFGRPSRLDRTSGATCVAGWSSIGLRIGFYNLGGANPCGRTTGHFSNALVAGPRWHTSRGLWVGDTARKLRRIYPSARNRAGGCWIVTRRSPVGTGSSYPGLLAQMRDGRVRAFVVRYPAGGD
jgi:hypothetical protein